MKSKKRGGLALLLECEIETPQLNASKLTIRTYGGLRVAGKLPSLNQQKLSLCHMKLYVFILDEVPSKHAHYLR